jgi:Do/DeqQ family serine protease
MNARIASRLVLIAAAAVGLGLLGAKRADKAEHNRPLPELKVDTAPVAAGGSPLVTSYADVLEPVQHAVVAVYSSKVVRHRIPPLFRQFFGDIPGEESRESGLGSGVIVSPDGYILTNNHVVAGADELNVSLADGREFKAELIGTDPKTEVAVIRIEGENLPTVTLADSDKLRVADLVFAVGNPLGIGQTVTMGIVSAKGRNNLGLLEAEEGYEDFIQTDAAINMGNSGGPLVDAKGRLIGINTAILSPTRGNIGIGFAIPVNLAASIMTSLVRTGDVQRGFLGVSVDPITAELAATLGLPEGTKGVAVLDVPAGGPADKAGLKRGDVIVRIGGRSVRSRQDLRLVVSQIAPGTRVDIDVIRDGKERKVAVELGSLSDARAASGELLKGVKVEPMTPETKRALGVRNDIAGLVITEVAPTSPYSRQMVPGMVVVEINRHPVPDLTTARSLLHDGRNLMLVYYRGTYSFLPVTIR